MKEDVGSILVWVKLYVVPVMAFSKDGLSAIATKLDTPLMLDSYTSYMCLQSWGRSSYARAMIELQADVELKDTIVVAMSNLNGEGFYTCTVRVEYKWKPHRCVCCKIFGHIQVECPKNPGLGVVKNLKTPIQAPRGVLAGPKVGFKPIKEYIPVSKKPTANTSGTKKKKVRPTKENVETINTSTTPIVDKIGKLKRLIIDGRATLVDDACKPMKKIEYPDDNDSEDEVESVDNDMARSMASDSVDFGTKSLLEQWRDSYENSDYDEDPYDDDMYESKDFPDKIQDICDNLDIRVRGRKKKYNLFSF
ncbi:retrotransposon protein, putative, ty1-copia subclass [Tanacetum coccineum]